MSIEMPAVGDMQHALRVRQTPTIVTWNRLEGRPKAPDFAAALRAEVRDALWMLTRQWQGGELRGDDAGSPVLARVNLTTTRLDRYRPGDAAVQPFDFATPLEAQVERRPVSFLRAGTPAALDLRLLMGRQWLKLLAKDGLGAFADAFRQRYPVDAPDPADDAQAPLVAHPEAWSGFAAVAGRRMDGGKLYLYLTGAAPGPVWEDLPGMGPAESDKVAALAKRFVEWFARLIHQPPADDAWAPDRLEYRFACSAPALEGEKVLRAPEYHHGRLDWYAVDVAAGVSTLGDPPDAPPHAPLGPISRTVIPTPVRFHGMPDTRWWAFEEGRTNFGEIKPDTTDLATLLVMDFGLMYANDWFLLPVTLPAGTLARVRGMMVTNVFGERTWVQAAGAGPDDAWQRWAMYLSSAEGLGNEAADTTLVMLPTVPRVQEGEPLEEVVMVRDEVANMVWGVEKTIPLPTGRGKPGAEAARELRAWYERLLPPPAAAVAATTARVRYRVMNSVPEHWIPFIPVHVPNDVRQVQLQRAAMPRFLEGASATPARVRPRTSLLRVGLDTEPKKPMYVHEEEVPRAGVRVSQAFQRTRWRDGRAWVWLGVHKQVGRGEGSSGLAFDQLVDLPPPA